MSIARQYMANKINGTKPAKHRAMPLAEIRDADMHAQVRSVIEILESMEHCPVSELVKAAKGMDLNPFQKVAVNRWLMEQAYPKPKSIVHSGDSREPVRFVIEK